MLPRVQGPNPRTPSEELLVLCHCSGHRWLDKGWGLVLRAANLQTSLFLPRGAPVVDGDWSNNQIFAWEVWIQGPEREFLRWFYGIGCLSACQEAHWIPGLAQWIQGSGIATRDQIWSLAQELYVPWGRQKKKKKKDLQRAVNGGHRHSWIRNGMEWNGHKGQALTSAVQGLLWLWSGSQHTCIRVLSYALTY